MKSTLARLTLLTVGLSATTASSVARAAEPDVRVVVTGVVERNDFRSGTYNGVPANAPVTMTIDLDSTNYLESAALPGRVRGYRFAAGSFSLSIGAVTNTLRTSPAPSAFFCIRNNDPGVDGFFLSQGTDIDVEIPLQMTPTNYGIGFLRTFSDVNTLHSLNLREAVGSWAYDNISSFNFAIQRGEFSTPLLINYQTVTVCLITPSCTADFNRNGTLDPDDLSDFIVAFFTQPPATGSDFNTDGAVNPDDLADFIAAFFTGC